VLTDVNRSMLEHGRDRLTDCGVIVPAVQCDAERLPFRSGWFDCVCVGFGLRNVTRKEVALAEMTRLLRPGGRLVVLEFSHVWKPLAALYDWYSFQVLPRMGQVVAGNGESYRYLAESIRVHPDQDTLKQMMEAAGLERVDYVNLTAGVVALHRGYRV
jgi:demethylmenaquinone methyltransferase/2-methoxy-6-polyprenyl-1,4-benzoquinol methylase